MRSLTTATALVRGHEPVIARRWRPAAFALAGISLLWVAIYNGYPVVWWDSGAYLASSVSFDVPVSRPVFYGLFMAVAGSRLTLWGVVVLQSAILVFLLRQTLVACRRDGVPSGQIDRALVGIAVVLALCTALPWVAGEAMPDVFTSIAVLSLFLTVSTGGVLFSVLFVLSLVVHFTHVPLAAGLLVVAAVASRLGWAVPAAGLRRAAVCLLVALLLIPATNRALAGRWFFSDATPNMLLDHFLAQGITQKLLAERCPGARYTLCSYRSNLPEVAGRYLWDPESPFTRVGGWQSASEASRLVRDTVRAYPLLVLQRTAATFVTQLTRFRTFAETERFGQGTGINYQVATSLPWEHDRYLRSRQQQGRLRGAAFRSLHLWVGALSAATVAFLAFARRRKRPHEALLHLLCISAVVLNAAVIASAGSPDDRYTARVMWLLTFSALASLVGTWRVHLAGSARRS